jgi:hypothetical protein
MNSIVSFVLFKYYINLIQCQWFCSKMIKSDYSPKFVIKRQISFNDS